MYMFEKLYTIEKGDMNNPDELDSKVLIYGKTIPRLNYFCIFAEKEIKYNQDDIRKLFQGDPSEIMIVLKSVFRVIPDYQEIKNFNGLVVKACEGKNIRETTLELEKAAKMYANDYAYMKVKSLAHEVLDEFNHRVWLVTSIDPMYN